MRLPAWDDAPDRAPARVVRQLLDDRAMTDQVLHVVEDEYPLPEVVVPELAYVLALARDLAWSSHCNVIGLRYVERREAHARLRGALAAYDQVRRSWTGEER